MRALISLLRKDMLVEFRTKETLFATVGMALLLGVVTSLGVSSAFLSPTVIKSIFPVLLILNILFAGILTISKSFEYEFKDGAIFALVKNSSLANLVFISKAIINFFVSLIGLLVSYATLVSLLNVTDISRHFDGILIGILLLIGFVSLATLLIPLTVSSRLRVVVLPLVLLPLMFPLLFGSLELMYLLIDGGSIDFSSPWISLLIGFDVIYFILGTLLFEQVIAE